LRFRESFFVQMEDFRRFESEFRAFATDIRNELQTRLCSVQSSLSKVDAKPRSDIGYVSDASAAQEDERVPCAFRSVGDDYVFKVAVVGPRADSQRRQKLIVLAEQFESSLEFEFLNVDEGPEPEGTHVSIFCGVPPPSEWGPNVLRVCFRGDADREAEVEIDLQTGEGIASSLRQRRGGRCWTNSRLKTEDDRLC
jgi:hypothetical protein